MTTKQNIILLRALLMTAHVQLREASLTSQHCICETFVCQELLQGQGRAGWAARVALPARRPQARAMPPSGPTLDDAIRKSLMFGARDSICAAQSISENQRVQRISEQPLSKPSLLWHNRTMRS
jgi:hypothetical protein